MKHTVRILVGALATIAIAAAVWIISLPNMAECRASGRIVDPTERHCESGAMYQQLQEHATFHAVQVVILFCVALAGAYILYRIIRRLRRAAASA
ncbi:MAG: hypothetical protein ACREOG_12085 [Gemmatimonadaceae bacterium]